MTIAPGELATAQDVNAALALRLLAGLNLSDVPNKALARSNLGLGGMATEAGFCVAMPPRPRFDRARALFGTSDRFMPASNRSASAAFTSCAVASSPGAIVMTKPSHRSS